MMYSQLAVVFFLLSHWRISYEVHCYRKTAQKTEEIKKAKKKTINLQRKLRKKWEFNLVHKANMNMKNKAESLWKIIALIKNLKPGKNTSIAQQAFEDKNGKLNFGSKGADVLKEHFEELGDPDLSKNNYCNEEYKKVIDATYESYKKQSWFVSTIHDLNKNITIKKNDTRTEED